MSISEQIEKHEKYILKLESHIKDSKKEIEELKAKNTGELNIKYCVVKIETNCRGNSEIRRFEFNDIARAIEKHIDESRGYQEEGGYWDICVEYSL